MCVSPAWTNKDVESYPYGVGRFSPYRCDLHFQSFSGFYSRVGFKQEPPATHSQFTGVLTGATVSTIIICRIKLWSSDVAVLEEKRLLTVSFCYFNQPILVFFLFSDRQNRMDSSVTSRQESPGDRQVSVRAGL